MDFFLRTFSETFVSVVNNLYYIVQCDVVIYAYYYELFISCARKLNL